MASLHRGTPFRLLASSLFLLAFGLACDGARTVSGVCSFNRDCAEGERCVSGACVPQVLAASCLSASDCLSTETCSGGVCTPTTPIECGSDADCPSSHLCNTPTAICLPRSGGVCATSQDCGSGQLCELGQCKDESVVNRTCVADDACASGEICHRTKCTPGCASRLAPLKCETGTSCDVTSGRCNADVKSCNADADCGSAAICISAQCEVRCDLPGGLVCTGGYQCDSSTGRCGGTSSCTLDSECGAPAGICESGRCVPGCGQLGPGTCGVNSVCDTNVGRCVALEGPCSADADCGPPSRVCEGGQCVGGCAQAGGFQCSGATSCNPASGRCGAGGPFCTNDTECAGGQVCNLLSGVCEANCQSTGCVGGETCQASGHCTNRVCTPDGFEPNDAAGSATALQVGNYGALSLCGGDQDFYSFDLLTGDPLEIQVLFRHAEGDINLELRGPANQVVASGVSTTDNESITLAAPSDGRYVLRVFMTQDLGPQPGNTYSLDLGLECGEDRFEPNDTEATARPSTPPVGELNLAVCPENDDFYAFNVTLGQEIRIEARFSDADGDIDLRLIEPSGTTAQSASSTSDNETIVHTAEETGRYVLRVFLFGDSGRRPGNRYDLDITVGGATPPVNPPPPPATCTDDRFEQNDTEATATLITAGTQSNLRLCAADLDFYGFDLQAQDQVQLSLRFVHAEGDIDAQVLGPTGSVIASGSSSTNDEILSFTAQTAGRYLLSTSLFADSGASPGNDYSFELSITTPTMQCTADEFEPNNTVQTAPALWPGSSTGLTLCPGDDDFYTVGLVVEDRVTISLAFSHAEGDIDLSLLGPSGTTVASSASATDNESLTYVVTQSGLHRIRARLFGDTGSQPGNGYDLSFSLVPPSSCQPDSLESNNSSSSPRALQPGGYLTLTACDLDDDWYSLSLSAGVTYTFAALFAHAEGDVDIGLFDSAGTVVASSVTELDDEIFEFTPTTSGTYRFLVRLFEDAGTIPGNRYDMVVLDQ